MFFPGSPCGCCGCKPCPYCSPACLTATFSGFAHGTENCNECSFLDDTTFVLKRPPANGRNHFLSVAAVDADGPDEGETANGSGASFGQPSVTANGTITNFARRADGSYYVTAVTINSGGSGYDTPTLTFTPTNFFECRKPTVSVTVTNGTITAVTVEEGGEYWLDTPCVYSGESCAVCPENAGQKLTATLTIGSTSNTIEISRGGTVIVSATQSNTDDEDAPIPCDDFTFEAENVTGCTTNGTISITSGACGDSSSSGCDLPDSITLTVAGLGPALLWRAQGGGSPPEGDPFDGQCGNYANICRIRGVGSLLGVPLWRGELLTGFTATLDRSLNYGCAIVYEGPTPAPPGAGGASGSADFVECGGGFDYGSFSIPGFATVQISPAGLGTTVLIDGPTNAGEGAEAEVTGVGEGGEITQITITNPGSGYAREIFDRVAPTVTAESVSTGGTDAVLAVTLQQYGSGEQAVWSVDSVTVTSGGTGYTGQESLVFSVAEGDTAEWGAYGVIVTGREEPTISASVSSGTGAELEVVLTQTVDYEGNDVWEVSSVTVSDGGTGYDDGENVTFTVDDGVEVFSASATTVVGREEPAVTAGVSSAGGSGAVLSVTLQAGVSNDWSVDDVTITDGGVDYEEYDTITFSTSDTEQYGASAYVSSVDQDGAITGISLLDGGSYYKSTGVIESVTLGYGGGQYYKSTGSIESVTIYDGGAYYRLESTGTADVDEPAVSIGSNIGFGATATATVDGTVGSATFGQITAISITAGGEEYRTGGTGWILGVSGISGLSHRDAMLVNCEEHEAFVEPVANRVTASPCPTSLLSKTYNMAFNTGVPFGVDEACGDLCVDNVLDATFVSFGGGDITCTIAPA